MALELRQVEGRRRAFGDLGLGAVEDVKAEIEQRAGHLLAVDDDMALGQMPAARPHHQHGGLTLERVGLAACRVGEVDLAGPAVLQVGLALDHVGEDGRGRVLEIGHEDLGAGIERIDDHLAIDGAGDLDPAVEKVGRDLGDGPVAFADRFGLGEKVRQLAGVKVFLALHAPRQQLEAPSIEAPMQPGDERERLGAENFVLPTAGLGVDLDAGYSRVRCHEGLRKGVGRSGTHAPRPFRRLCGVPASAAVEILIKPRDRLARQRAVRAKPAAGPAGRTGPRRAAARSRR